MESPPYLRREGPEAVGCCPLLVSCVVEELLNEGDSKCELVKRGLGGSIKEERSKKLTKERSCLGLGSTGDLVQGGLEGLRGKERGQGQWVLPCQQCLNVKTCKPEGLSQKGSCE